MIPPCFQLKHYPNHRPHCKNAALTFTNKTRIIQAAELGLEGSCCNFCSKPPTDFTAHLFVKCKICWVCCRVETLYCGADCQRKHSEAHYETCKKGWLDQIAKNNDQGAEEGELLADAFPDPEPRAAVK